MSLAQSVKSLQVGEIMRSSKGEKAPSKEPNSFIRTLLTKLRKRHIIETLAAFIGGGWLLIEVVERLFVACGDDGNVRVLDADTLRLLKTISGLEDADNMCFDAKAGLIYVGYGSGGLASAVETVHTKYQALEKVFE